MVLKEKEDLCNWFKGLHPRKRIDYVCGLLHLCLPLELRFIGTVLEDIAKKDFNYLRDAENKANNPSELTIDGSQSFADGQFRAKIQVNLALMHSSDGSCADIIFGILEKQFNNLTNYLQDAQVLEEILTILTLACHHPAFKIHQRLRLGEILKTTEDHCQHQWVTNNSAFPKNYQTVPASCRLSKGITSIFVHGIRDEVQNKKSGPDYEIHTSWSNGDVTQHFMKHKELQTLHHQIFNKFPDEKRLQHLFPSVTGQRRYRHESKEEKISTINSYFSELSKAQNILACDILTRTFQNGKPVPVSVQVPSQQLYYPAYMHHAHYPDGLRLAPVQYYQSPALNMIHAMPPSGLSSSTTSPSNSRSSSPSITLNNNNNNKNTRALPDADKGGVVGHNRVKAGVLQLQQQQVVADATLTESLPQVETVQLLRLLDLEKYSKILAGYTLHEVSSMTTEEMAKIGLPADAQMTLQSRLDQQKHSLQDMNGVIQVQAAGSNKQDRVMHSSPNWQGHMPMPDATAAIQTPPPSLPYPAVHQYHIVSPQNAIQSPVPSGTDNSPSAASDQCTLSLSPGVNSPDSPPSSLASPTSVYLEDKSAKNHQPVDSSGSEEDRVMGFEGNDSASYRGRGPNRPQQSISLPLLNSNASSPGLPEKGKVMGVPASVSAPVMANEAIVAREAGTPPMMINGFGSENSYMPHNYVMSFSTLQQPHQQHHQHHPHHHQQQQQQQQQHHPHHRYKSAQPTHTGPRMHKNVVNMPCLDMTTQPPPPAPSINKNPIIHSAMLHHSYLIQPNSSMIHQAAQQQPTNNAPPQQLPASQALMPPSMQPTADNGGNISTLPFMPTIVPAGPNFMPPQSRSVMTTLSNSSTPPLPGQQQHQQPTATAAVSHSPSPVAAPAPVQPEHGQQSAYIHQNPGGDGLEGRHDDGGHHTPTPTHPNNKPANLPGHNNNNGALSHMPNMSGPGSGTATPSPPLPPPPPPHKQIVVTSDSSSHPQHQTMFVPPPMYMIPNITGNMSVTMPPYSANPHHQQNSLQHFPNGMPPEMYLQAARFQLPIGSGQLPSLYYGSQPYNNPHIHHHNNNNNGNGNLSHHASGNGGGNSSNNNGNGGGGGGGGKVGGKNSCYNCGLSGHKANECKESPMDSMTNSFRLNIKPKSDSE